LVFILILAMGGAQYNDRSKNCKKFEKNPCVCPG